MHFKFKNVAEQNFDIMKLIKFPDYPGSINLKKLSVSCRFKVAFMILP